MKNILLMIALALVLVGCNNSEEIMENNTIRRDGTSSDTFAFPSDIDDVYNYGSGKIEDLDYSTLRKRLPSPSQDETVTNTPVDPSNIQILYLWNQGNVPTKTTFTSNMTGYNDNYDFRPYVTAIPVKEGVEVKGAVVLLAGGAFQVRANYSDTLPTAMHLRELGFRTFIVDYRLSPYTMQEGALDVSRAVKFIRNNAETYGIDSNDIAVMGYSAGGIQAGELIINFQEKNGSEYDSSYIPDELDKVSNVVAADGMIYSFYGRLSVASMDKELLQSSNLPPTFYCYGTEDPFYQQFEAQYELMQEINVETKRIVLNDWPHGFGGDGGWIKDYASWLEDVFSR